MITKTLFSKFTHAPGRPCTHQHTSESDFHLCINSGLKYEYKAVNLLKGEHSHPGLFFSPALTIPNSIVHIIYFVFHVFRVSPAQPCWFCSRSCRWPSCNFWLFRHYYGQFSSVLSFTLPNVNCFPFFYPNVLSLHFRDFYAVFGG